MRIASWNVNSIQARLPHLEAWLKTFNPDVILLQELKTLDENFPLIPIQTLGYEAFVKGQKSYNGVAILVKNAELPPPQLLRTTLPGMEQDEQARYLEILYNNTHILCLYAPNGNPMGTEKYTYKLSWLRALRDYIKILLQENKPFVIAGDFNIIPEPQDCSDPKLWVNDALYQTEVRDLYREIQFMGTTDAFRTFYPNQKHAYTFWDYQAGAWQKDAGIRIDHFILSPLMAEHQISCAIDNEKRAEERPSDHVPIYCDFKNPQ